jgi:hypothetical protein
MIIRPLPDRARRARRADDAGSIPLAMLLTLVGITLSTVLATIVIAQITNTRTNMQRVTALGAAQAGVDVAVSHLRAAVDGTVDAVGNVRGDQARLPCDSAGSSQPGIPQLEGQAGVATTRYQVLIAYLPATLDPHGKDDQWVYANAIACTAGSGPISAPGFAVLISTGTVTAGIDGTATRQLRATYTFRLTSSQVVGGPIRTFRPTTSSPDLCLDAGPVVPPPTGQLLKVQTCNDSPAQQFAYTDKLNLLLAATRSGSAKGMCVDAAPPTAAAPSYTAVTFQPCSLTAPRQVWSWNRYANFQGTTNLTSQSGSPFFCLNMQNPNTVNSNVIAVRRCGENVAGETYNTTETFFIDASAGAGKAGKPTGQLVNREQFGRCVDVTNGNVTFAGEYLVAWPCKQDPGGVVEWNQKWALPTITVQGGSATGRITTSSPSGLNCLTLPVAPSKYVWLSTTSCASGTITNPLKWTRFEDTTDNLTKYTIRAYNGLCLTLTDPAVDRHTDGADVSKLVLAPCDGSLVQKWNAPAKLDKAVPLKDIGEGLGD